MLTSLRNNNLFHYNCMLKPLMYTLLNVPCNSKLMINRNFLVQMYDRILRLMSNQ